ncbi:MAG: HAMP domain-containing histidine kinase [Mogibacterium sp.]|nr:HAMP domain-containing histidine kinase [Mogibacterium sp.]
MNGSRVRRILFIILFLAAMGSIGLGIYEVWTSFIEFDESMLKEKDSQYYSLIRSNDINIENTLDSFTREAEILFSRPRLAQLRSEWSESGHRNSAELEKYIEENTLTNNPVYADMLVMYKDKIYISASGNTKYKFVTGVNSKGLRICTDKNGKFYIAYEYEATKNIRYEALIKPEELYINSVGPDSAGDIMLLDNSSSIVMFKSGQDVIAVSVSAETDDNTSKCVSSLVGCQEAGVSNGVSLDLAKDDGEVRNARMIAIPSSESVNGEFAIGVIADYEEAVRPSRRAAERILIYGGVAVAGIVLLLFMILLLRRENTSNARELEMLKQKNSQMAELNRNMLALSHHQRLETIGTMTASIAHDFNNLLTPIMGYSLMSIEALPEGTEDIQENLMEVYNASVKAKDMVTRLADLTKKGKEENFTALDPAEIISNSLKVTLPAKPKNVEVKVRYRSNNRTMRGDATQISQLVMNIVLNAYDAMREKGGTMFISTGIEDNRIAMRFRDTGGGMDSETVARIFDPFFTTKESGKGTGLGLAIVAQIAETHGGSVYVDSTPGVGTEFRITFPMLEKETKFDKSKTIQISVDELHEAMKENE